mmetsp:Transcript_27442/g.73842  ORF Transcript_27442/g.73842 Transcript_27442/m.73842 type:complete len:503 (+) Transcript_27442:59-1567(+)
MSNASSQTSSLSSSRRASHLVSAPTAAANGDGTKPDVGSSVSSSAASSANSTRRPSYLRSIPTKVEKAEADEKLKQRFRKIVLATEAVSGVRGEEEDEGDRLRRQSMPAKLRSNQHLEPIGAGVGTSRARAGQDSPTGAEGRAEEVELTPGKIRPRFRRHSVEVTIAGMTSSSIAVEPASPSPSTKRLNKARGSSFVKALGKALQPAPIFRESSGAESDASSHASEGAADQTYDEFIASAKPLPKDHIIVMVPVGRVTRDGAAGVRAAAAATSGFNIVVLEPILQLRRKHASILEDIVEHATHAVQRAVQAQEVNSKVWIILAVSGEKLDRRPPRGIVPGTANVVFVPCVSEVGPSSTVTALPELGNGAATLQRERRPSLAGKKPHVNVSKVAHHTQRVLGRLIGIESCSKYACAFAAYQQDTKLEVCPVCMRKLLWATPQTLDSHYAAQKDLQAAARLGTNRERRLSVDQQRLYGYLANAQPGSSLAVAKVNEAATRPTSR